MNNQDKLAWRTKPLREAGTNNLGFWLQDRGSLTARLQSQGTFAVKLLRQELARPTGDEAAVLNIRPDQLAWVREVALYCDGKPMVFAHTVLPYRPRGPLSRWLSRLGNQSLGALLFAHHGFRRGPPSLQATRSPPRAFSPGGARHEPERLPASRAMGQTLDVCLSPAIRSGHRSVFAGNRCALIQNV